MKTDLDILIEHYQAEVDHLQARMDECIAGWDFDVAKGLRQPLGTHRRQLSLLMSLKDPQYRDRVRMQNGITRLRKMLKERVHQGDRLYEKWSKFLHERRTETVKSKIAELEAKLETLAQMQLPDPRPDNDRILSLLASLKDRKCDRLTFEFENSKLKIKLSRKGAATVLSLHAAEKERIEDYLLYRAKSTLIKLGFDSTTWTKDLGADDEWDSLALLTELSIICYEVFDLLDEQQVNVLVDGRE